MFGCLLALRSLIGQSSSVFISQSGSVLYEYYSQDTTVVQHGGTAT